MNDTVSIGSSPRRIRQNNIVAALQTIYAHRSLSRADLARKLGMNRSSSGEIVAELTEGGFVQESEESGKQRLEHSRAGRPGIMLELVPDAAFFVGIEIGVEHISAVVVDLSAEVRACRKMAFDTPSSTVEEAVAQGIELIIGAMAKRMIDRCKGLGLSTPSHVRPDGFVTLAPIIGWRDVPLKEIARSAFPAAVPIAVENDANAFAIGDSYRHGVAGVTLFLLMETGVGGGIMIDGKLFRGGHGLAGEIGHTLVPGSGGQKLEQLIGREVLIKQYREAIGRDDADLQDFLGGVRDRVPAAVNIAETWSRHLAYALLQACRLLDPDRIVLGGSVASLYPMVAARVAVHMSEGQNIAFPTPEIVVDDDAEFRSAFGAACMLHRRFLSLESEEFGSEDGVPVPSAMS
ncbi:MULTISPECIES: ROK family transcriptional regulator [unclassified Rhizobium]|uniref:ROK family transcriptional regulator n=1 Tax=unclassified Rhizobium TaxID=2613769 RepID=UPI001A9992C2|nr:MULTISPECIES: ROK family transcriptional regulator [unclassified Rhizobium]MBX5159442.1 ROK family transcriptional regulator [Rhizobium sp. NZLR8]MBX5162427.1 ROK family transcriptional regulator [Rhizobium sp. NZLR4b]MBX5170802.1 ROK family transcriptional regulator [Rhizobium sp. NZLR1b]MBX5181580.1 ROK family transcriptional regulator [Rhizobium sp. NZLR5]MBX5196548.1 ROK family transcriptional regulator [Rhizobium sp. NZLR10]